MGSSQQTCKACGRPDKFDFHVRDDVWIAVVPPKLRMCVVCLFCFDDFAQEQGVNYASSLHTLYFAGKKASFVFKATERKCRRG